MTSAAKAAFVLGEKEAFTDSCCVPQQAKLLQFLVSPVDIIFFCGRRIYTHRQEGAQQFAASPAFGW